MSAIDSLCTDVLSGRVSRRDFVTRAAALGIMAPAAARMMQGAALAEDTPKKGGHLVLALDTASTGDGLDPAFWGSQWIETLGYQWGNGLTEPGANSELLPDLAETWEPNQSFTKWVFKVRKSVQFHNGKEMTAEDVVFSINHHRGPNSKSGGKGLVSSVTNVSASDKYEVTIELDSPNADFPYNFTDCRFIVVPSDSDFTAGIGTGGYILEHFQPGVKAIARRNPNYWKENRAHVDSIETLAANDPTARFSALVSGTAHFINNIDPKVAERVKALPNLQLINVPTSVFYMFAMLCDTPPFNDKDVRLALKYAIDREDVVKRVLRGFGSPGNDQPIGATFRYYANDIPQHTYDPDKASFHLKKSGYDGAFTLTTADSGFPGAVDTASLFKTYAAKAGLNIDVDRVPEDGYWQNIWMKKPFCPTYWTGRSVEDMILSLSLQSDAPYNETHWRRPDFDKLLIAARGERDDNRRKEMYRDMQVMISDDGGILNFAFANMLFGASAKVRGFFSTAAYTGFRVGEQLFFA